MLTWQTDVFALGAIGAFAPEVVRLWTLRLDRLPVAWSTRYVVASILMCTIGGIVALCLAPDTPWKSMYAGITAPILISAAGRRLPKRKPVKLKNSGDLDMANAAGPDAVLDESAVPLTMSAQTYFKAL